MKSSLFQKTVKAVKTLSLVSLAALGLNGCGSGGGGSNGFVVAPESLELVTVRLFGAFDLQFFRTSGVAGNEAGGVDYDLIDKEFRVATGDGGTSVGRDITIPSVLTNVKYTYVRTGLDTGRITVTYFNNEVYPHPAATAGNTPILLGDLFWGGPARLQTELILDVLFGSNGTNIATSTTRVRSAWYYDSTFTAPGPAIIDVSPLEFDSTTAQFSLNGAGLPAGYNPYSTFSDTTPASVVWTTIQGRTIDLNGSDFFRKVAHQATGGSGPSLDGVTPEETGSILVDSAAEGVLGGSGTYSYARTGGTKAKFAISYNGQVVLFSLDFDALDGGSYTDNNSAIGTFLEDNFTDL